ncbi:efflux RND transporter permease subunit [Litorilituus lipolyticus]|uniref:Efflux RND transporter permease subunit n=1 Tax=Litorilituus lipolyticus TaxID=2491017 RepID=A0A502KUG8_9GAMM|nr:efflux RND transporter permease subunit [Litorilituus lipolyticus]TPH13273.1 efflux RND transporter permease subunit [Litorilituus lipolyticus]
MKLPLIAIENKQFTLTVTLLLLLIGIVSYVNMPRSEDPQFDLPITIIEVVYPGASPNDVETLVVDPLEREIAEIESIKKIESIIHNGSVRITIEFIYGTDAEASFNKVKQAVSTVQPDLPSGVENLLVLKATPTSVAIMQLAIWTEPTDYKIMELNAELLAKRLEMLSGVRKADIWGYPRQIVAIDVDTQLLKHYGIAVTDINKTLSGRALNITPGYVDASSRRFNVKASGNFTQIADIENTVIKTNHKQGESLSTLHIKDIAKVSFASSLPSYLAYYDEKPVIFITIEQREKTNIFDLTTSINNEIEHFKNNLTADIKIAKLFQQSDSVEVRVNGFFNNLLQGLAIVGIMALLFLGVKESMVVIVAIPLSFLIAIGWLDFAGFGLQQMSIVGLIIALGLLVDNAIVVTESIHREKAKTKHIKQAAIQGTSNVAWAVSSGTVTTMLAFLPMLMLSSSTGDFIRSMPVTVVLVLLASLLIALTVTPLLASHLFSEQKNVVSKTSRIKSLQHYVNAFAEGFYAKTLAILIRFRLVVILVAIICLAAMLSLFKQVGVSLFPKAEKPMILVDVAASANSSLAYTDNVMQQVSRHLKAYSLVDEVALNVGNSNPRIYYNEIPKRGMAHLGQALVILKEYQVKQVNDLVQSLRDSFSMWPQAKITVKEFTQGPVTDQPIAIRLMSESLDDLERVANDLANKMKVTQGIVNIDNPIGLANTELALQIDYEKAARSHLDINLLDNTVKTLLSGMQVGTYNDENGEDYSIVVRKEKPTVESLSRIELVNQLGDSIPLTHVATIKLKKGDTDFFHYQKLRMAKVSADVEQGYSISEITQSLVDYLTQYGLPKGMYFSLGGEEESRQDSFAGLTKIMLITAIGIFAVLVLQFGSILQPMIIFTSIPFAMAGSVIGLYFTGLSFSMMAFVGLISLFGIVVNNAIILIDTANKNMQQGLDKKTAILQASSHRFTPILLTTLTTIGGLVPLTLFGGALWQPLGVVLISGLCVSALSSFLLVPILTELFTKKSVKVP